MVEWVEQALDYIVFVKPMIDDAAKDHQLIARCWWNSTIPATSHVYTGELICTFACMKGTILQKCPGG